MSNIEHAKKHDINDSKNHIKNELELNNYLMLQDDKYLWFGGKKFLKPENMSDWGDNLTNWTGSGLSLDGTDKIEGANSIVVNASGTQTYRYTFTSAIDLTNAETLHWWVKRVSKNATINYIRFYTDASNYYEVIPNKHYNFLDWYELAFDTTSFTAVGSPNWNNIIYFELNQTNTAPAGIVKWNKIYFSSQKGWVGNANINATTLSGNLNITGYTSSNFIGDGSNLTNVTPDMNDDIWFYMDTNDTKGIRWNSYNGYVELKDNLFINGILANVGEVYNGDGGLTNYSYFDTDGYLKMFGNARVWKTLKHYGYTLYGFSGTYNGISTNATSLAVIGSQYATQQFKKGGFGSNPSSFITTFVIPDNYVSGEDLKIILNWTSDSTGGNVHYGVGIAPIKEGDLYNTPNYTYVVGNYAESLSNYGAIQTEITFTAPLINSGDELGVIVYRDIDNSGDTSSGNSYVSSVVLKYVADKLGEKVD